MCFYILSFPLRNAVAQTEEGRERELLLVKLLVTHTNDNKATKMSNKSEAYPTGGFTGNLFE